MFLKLFIKNLFFPSLEPGRDILVPAVWGSHHDRDIVGLLLNPLRPALHHPHATLRMAG